MLLAWKNMYKHHKKNIQEVVKTYYAQGGFDTSFLQKYFIPVGFPTFKFLMVDCLLKFVGAPSTHWDITIFKAEL